MTSETIAPNTRWQKTSLALSAVLAVAYGVYGSSLYEGASPFVGTLFKASSIIILGLIALIARSRLLAVGLLFGALGDALLAWGHETFLYGALAFLIGHLFYITLYLTSKQQHRPPARSYSSFMSRAAAS